MYLRVLKDLKGLSGVLKFKVLKKVNQVVKVKGDNQYHCHLSRNQSYAILGRGFEDKNRRSDLITRFLPKGSKIRYCYEPTNIAWTRESLFWRWRRVKEYYQELFEPDWDSALKAVKSMM